MDLSFLAPFRTSAHQAAEHGYTLSKESVELWSTQSKIAQKQMVSAMESWTGLVMAQQQAMLSMGRVVVDAMKPASPAA